MERITVKDTATMLGVSEQFVRVGLQKGFLPIGSCVKLSSKWTYHISPHLLEQYTGKKIPPAATGGNRRNESAERTI